MSNYDVKFNGNKMTIEVDLKKDIGLSSSKKSIMLATSNGNVRLQDGLIMGLNVYKKNPDYVKPEKEATA